jgi:hypothetical protein
MKANEHIVRGVLEPGVGLMQLAGGLAGQLAELVTIGHVRECRKYQIRTHDPFSFQYPVARDFKSSPAQPRSDEAGS